MIGHTPNAADFTAARRTALVIDLLAVAASLAANIAASRQTLAGWLVSSIAPLGLFLAIILWHRSHGVVVGWLGRAFTAGLGAIAIGGCLDFIWHLRDVAVAAGQGATAAKIIPLVIDGAAVLATIVVISAGQRLNELAETEAEAIATAESDAAEAEADRLAAVQRAETERAEADRLAVVEAKRIAADTAETERLAVAERERGEAERTAALERERIEAAERVELARIAAEKEAAETTARNERLAASAAAAVSGPAEIGPGGRAAKSKAVTTQAIGDFLAEHPDAKQAEVAEAVGCTTKTVQRSQAWVDHKATVAA